MKKIILSLMLLGSSISLFGSQNDELESNLQTLKKLVLESLCNKQDGLDALRRFANDNRGFLDSSKEVVLSCSIVGDRSLLESLNWLDERLFPVPLKKSIVTALFPDLTVNQLSREEVDGEEDIDNQVIDYIEDYLLDRFPYELLEYVFTANPIDVDSLDCVIHKRYTEAPYPWLGEVLDEDDTDYLREVASKPGSLERRNTVRNLVERSRSHKKAEPLDV